MCSIQELHCIPSCDQCKSNTQNKLFWQFVLMFPVEWNINRIDQKCGWPIIYTRNGHFKIYSGKPQQCMGQFANCQEEFSNNFWQQNLTLFFILTGEIN